MLLSLCEHLQQDFILVTDHVSKMYRYDLSGNKYKYEGKECAINSIIRRFARKKMPKILHFQRLFFFLCTAFIMIKKARIGEEMSGHE